MARGSDIASTLPATHTLEREQKIFDAVAAGCIAAMHWLPVPVSHTFADGRTIRGTVYMAEQALRLGDETDNFRPNYNHITSQRIADILKRVPAANAPDGVVCPTAKLLDFKAKASVIKLDPCTQGADSHMGDTARGLQHSRCVDKARAGRRGHANTEGKAWANTTRLIGHPELAANYGLFADGALYRSVLGMPLWQPGPGTRHISGFNNKKFPQGYTDYSQVGEGYVLVMMDVEGRGAMDIRVVARDPVLCWLVSSEGPLELRHPAVPDPAAPGDAPVVSTPRAPLPLLTRTLRLTSPPMTGQDVGFVQGIVMTKQDLVFGPKTKAAVESWQRTHRDLSGMPLTVDGIVGPRTRAAMLASITKKADEPEYQGPYLPLAYDPSMAVYREARYYDRNVLRDTVHWIVLHAAEAADLPTTAEALAAYFATMADGRQASAHWNFDNDSGTRSVPEERVAWHAKKANRYGVGYEHAGYTRQSRAEWLDDYSASMLHISACTAARVTCPRWKIPMDNFVDAAGLRRAYADYIDKGKPVPDELRGFTTHHEVTKGLGGSHTDPGDLPIDVYLDWVKEAA